MTACFTLCILTAHRGEGHIPGPSPSKEDCQIDKHMKQVKSLPVWKIAINDLKRMADSCKTFTHTISVYLLNLL